jgi:hypothetical protein
MSYFLMSHSLTLGIILGGLVIIANFKVLQHTIRRGFSPEGIMAGSKILIILKYYFRLLGMGVVIYFSIKSEWVDPIGLAIGLSTVVISITAFGVRLVWKGYT